MTVKDLITQLEGLDPNMDVYLSSDSEGNNIHPYDGTPFTCYTPDNDDEGEFLSKEDYLDTYEEEVEENAVVLFPL